MQAHPALAGIGHPLRWSTRHAPRGRTFGTGPNAFQVNKTADAVNVTKLASDRNWRLHVTGAHTISLSRAQLLAMDQHTYEMPIACVEGWSTTQHWSGVRLRDLARMAGGTGHEILEAMSLQPSGPYRHVAYSPQQVSADAALLALRVNGSDLSLDHGYPARIIMPALPGVHCMKWVGSLKLVMA